MTLAQIEIVAEKDGRVSIPASTILRIIDVLRGDPNYASLSCCADSLSFEAKEDNLNE